jgi:hypothetical protein
MPILASLGAGSIGAYRMFGGASWPIDGTFGIFSLGRTGSGGGDCGVTTRERYTFASDTSTTCGVGAASVNSRSGSAAGNATRAIFALGLAGGAYSATRNKYTYATNVSTASGVPSASLGGNQQSAVGNSTRGIFALGFFPPCRINGANQRDKYTYACDTSTAATSASQCNYGGSAAGNSTRGIFHLGLASNARSSTRNKYTYACDASTSVGVATASTASYAGSATGNSTRGIFTIGCRSSGGIVGSCQRNKYTYATDTNTTCGVASASEQTVFGSAAGNSTRGIFAIGCNSTSRSATRNKYTYACDTNTASGVASASVQSGQGTAASWATCVNSP